MSGRTTAFGVGLMLAGLAGYAAIGSDETKEGTAILQSGPIHNQHVFGLNVPPEPAPGCYLVHVTAHKTMEFLNPVPCDERPFCVNGHLAKRPPFGVFNGGRAAEEWLLEDAVCAGKLSPEEAAQQLREDWPLDAAHGYDR